MPPAKTPSVGNKPSVPPPPPPRNHVINGSFEDEYEVGLLLRMAVINAFIDENKSFSGNPAAVIRLREWLDDLILQQIASQNNLSETTFVVEVELGTFEIRWFTPEVEVDLCGHATLAAAYYLFRYCFIDFEKDYKDSCDGPYFYRYFNGQDYLREKEILFISRRSGLLRVKINYVDPEMASQSEQINFSDINLTLDFPTDTLEEISMLPELIGSFDYLPSKAFKGKTDYMLVYENEQQIKDLKIDFNEINKIDARGIIVTAPGENVDFVSRFFGCGCGIPEDPVTGSAHTTLTPYWSTVLQKNEMTAQQLSKRTGKLFVKLQEDRVLISGRCKRFSYGTILIDNRLP